MAPDPAQHGPPAEVLARATETANYLAAVPGLGDAVEPFLSTLPSIWRRAGEPALMEDWFKLVKRVAQLARPGTIPLVIHGPHLLDLVDMEGLVRWAEFGIATCRAQPQTAALFFGLRTADSHATLQRQRHGTLLLDRERELTLTLQAFWGLDDTIHPQPHSVDSRKLVLPHLDKLGFHVPDVLDDGETISAIDRYRSMLAHLAAHRLWSRPYFADNFSQHQHLAIEAIEDCRVDHLAIARHPGLRRLFLAQHPIPVPGSVPAGHSAIRHHMAMLSRAIMDPDHGYTDPVLLDFVRRFHEEFEKDPLDRNLSTRLGVAYLARIRGTEFRDPRIWFEDTVIAYRDDNRYLWQFLEDTDSEDDFHSDHGTEEPPDGGMMPPVHYPEFDYESSEYRPDWTTVYESRPPIGDGSAVDAMLERHQAVARRLKQVIDRLKPQYRRRIRRQSEGDGLDFDPMVSAAIDLRAGVQPDLRIFQRHVPDGRDIAVLLLIDLSHSINDETADGLTLLRLAQEATSLLAWAVGELGDGFAIAGFASKSRHEVRYARIKDFDEDWDLAAKGRLAGIEAGLATRMGAALRHGGEILSARPEAKKLLLLLSDGEPADIDVDDEQYLKADTHAAVGEVRAKGVHTYCVTLDAKADTYVADLFGPSGFAAIDSVASLPEKLTRLFLALTK